MRIGLTRGLSILVACLPQILSAAPIAVPSGQPVTFQDVIWEEEGEVNIYRFRYIAPEIARDGGTVGFEQAEQDLHYLCETSALPVLIEQKRAVNQIVITLSDRIVEFGKLSPDATQFIDAYRPEGTSCIWEGF